MKRCPSATKSTPACSRWSTMRPALGRQGHPHRDQGHPPAHEPGQHMGRQMKAEREKRAVILEAEGFRRPPSSGPRARSRALVLEAEGDKKPRSATPRPVSACPCGGGATADGVAGDREGSSGRQLFRGAEIRRGLSEVRYVAQSEDADDADGVRSAIGSLAGIAELARDAFAQGKAAPPAPWGQRPPEAS